MWLEMVAFKSKPVSSVSIGNTVPTTRWGKTAGETPISLIMQTGGGCGGLLLKFMAAPSETGQATTISLHLYQVRYPKVDWGANDAAGGGR
jgi:hypothetical protein